MNTPEVILVPVVIGLVQVAKIVGMSTRFAPLLAVVLAEVICILIGVDWLQGLMMGLIACGLWSGTKASVGK